MSVVAPIQVDKPFQLELDEFGVTAGGIFIGKRPCREIFATAMGNAPIRMIPKIGGARILNVADSLGLSFLSDTHSGEVFWLHVTLERPRWRQQTENDPGSVYCGLFSLNGKPFPFPLSVTLANLIPSDKVTDINLSFVPHGLTIASIGLGFTLNELDRQ